jgi:hypothetical protein
MTTEHRGVKSSLRLCSNNRPAVAFTRRFMGKDRKLD